MFTLVGLLQKLPKKRPLTWENRVNLKSQKFFEKLRSRKSILEECGTISAQVQSKSPARWLLPRKQTMFCKKSTLSLLAVNLQQEEANRCRLPGILSETCTSGHFPKTGVNICFDFEYQCLETSKKNEIKMLVESPGEPLLTF